MKQSSNTYLIFQQNINKRMIFTLSTLLTPSISTKKVSYQHAHYHYTLGVDRPLSDEYADIFYKDLSWKFLNSHPNI